MRVVRHAEGGRYLLVTRSADASLVRDPSTGEERYVATDDLEPVDEPPIEPVDDPALATVVAGVPEPVRDLIAAVPDERGLGMLLLVADRGPVAARTLLDAVEVCERDLNGRLTSLEAGDLVERIAIADDRGYDVTDRGRRVASLVRDVDATHDA